MDQRIEDLQGDLNFFMSQNPNEEQATRKIKNYLAQMGCYIGIQPKKLKDPNSTVNRSDANIGDDGKLKGMYKHYNGFFILIFRQAIEKAQ